MRELEKTLILFTENCDEMKKAFFDVQTIVPKMCALVSALKTDAPMTRSLFECKEAVENRRGDFGGLSDDVVVFLSTVISHRESLYNRRLDDLITIGKMLRGSFMRTPYMPLAAYVIENRVDDRHEWNNTAKKVRELYNRILEKHPFVTGDEDIAILSYYAVESVSNDELIDKLEYSTELLKEDFFFKNSMQSLSQILALAGSKADIDDAYRRMTLTMQTFNDKGFSIPKGYQLCALGVLSLLDCKIDEMADTVIFINDYLKKKTGFSSFSISKKDRHMIACLLFAAAHLKENHTDTADTALRACLLTVISTVMSKDEE